MESRQPIHERVRFRRDEIVRLDALPSAGPPVVAVPTRRGGVARAAGGVLAALISIIVLVPLAVYAIGVSGFGNERLRAEAEAALTRLAGRNIDAAIGSPRLSLGPERLLAVEIDNVRIVDAETPGNQIDAGVVRFGLETMPLLSGTVRLGSASIEDATIRIATLPESDGPDWTASLKGEDGLLDPALVMDAVYGGLRNAFRGLDRAGADLIELANVNLTLPAGAPFSAIAIKAGHVTREADGTLEFKLSAALDGRGVALSGTAVQGEDGRIDAMKAELTLDRTVLKGPAANGPIEGREFALVDAGGAIDLALTGSETSEGRRLALTGTLSEARVAFSGGDVVTGDARLAATVVPESRKIHTNVFRLNAGGAAYRFQGAAGPAPAVAGVAPHYRFELVTDGSTIAPGDSTEPDLPIVARIAGRYDPATRRIEADEIGVRTSGGEVAGKAVVTFVPGLSPGLDLVLSVASLPVSHAKQLWPWFAAKSAQAWATNNVFGGMIRRSSLSLSSAPGRIGDGVPMSSNEVSGHFEIEGARFDMTGNLPPVRDGFGIIDFRGTNVDIALKSGTVYMPTGRTAQASDGTLTLRDAHIKPVIGQLDISVQGSADALAELASYDPLDALRRLPFGPGDLTGDVKGRVSAQIPLQKGVDIARLNWTVSLDYQNLAIAKPFEGQMVTQADGTLQLDRTMAHIKAKAKVNGMDAELDISEPINGATEGRRRDIALVLDDKARNAMMPGLSTILSGPVRIKVESGEGGRNDLTADLTAARLSLPWVGWSKGAGVGATAVLRMQPTDSGTRIEGLKLSGESFEIAGSATLGKEGLSSLELGTVRLNRGDDIAMNLRRAGSGYRIDVRGKSYDARGLVKQLLGDPDKAEGNAKGVPIQLEAQIGSVSGFDGESISDVRVDYKGTGASVGNLTIAAQTKSGAAVTASNSSSGKSRTVQMQSSDAGALLRFLDLYPNMQGGKIALNVAAEGSGPLKGQIDARDFSLVNEPRLGSIVSTPSDGSQSLNAAVKRDIDTSRVYFERGSASIEKGAGYLSVANGVLRGPLIGTTFQGNVYDREGRMAITGTFMPAYGINRLFAEIPLFGVILGNGRDRGLIGITYKVAGDAKSPRVEVNPISAIAPGIFRSIFEYN